MTNMIYRRLIGICSNPICQEEKEIKKIEAHHIIKTGKKGRDNPKNLACLCKSCHCRADRFKPGYLPADIRQWKFAIEMSLYGFRIVENPHAVYFMVKLRILAEKFHMRPRDVLTFMHSKNHKNFLNLKRLARIILKNTNFNCEDVYAVESRGNHG